MHRAQLLVSTQMGTVHNHHTKIYLNVQAIAHSSTAFHLVTEPVQQNALPTTRTDLCMICIWHFVLFCSFPIFLQPWDERIFVFDRVEADIHG